MREFLPTEAELSKLSAFHSCRANFRIGVYGYGVVGRALVEFLRRNGVAHVTVIDGNSELEHPELDGVEWCLGPLRKSWIDDLDILFIGPGVEPRNELILDARKEGLLVIGELATLGTIPAQLVAITGTNGKSTTTAWTGFILDDLEESNFIGGNLGDPITGWALRGYPERIGVLELSSYQLETAYRLAPKVAVITNLAPDHASRYESNQEYYRAKSRIFHYQDEKDICIVRTDVLKNLESLPPGKVWTFGHAVTGDGFKAVSDAWQGQGIFEGLLLPWKKLVIPGAHNAENALCAVLSVWAIRGGLDSIDELWERAANFGGLEHRLEFVVEHNQVRFYNDSKATNDESAATALDALGEPIVWLAGGVSKGAGYSASMKFLTPKVRHLIAFGSAATEIKTEALGLGFAPGDISEVPSLSAAIGQISAVAVSGDNVLLSPACASFDEFKNFEERGAFFKEQVLGLH